MNIKNMLIALIASAVLSVNVFGMKEEIIYHVSESVENHLHRALTTAMQKGYDLLEDGQLYNLKIMKEGFKNALIEGFYAESNNPHAYLDELAQKGRALDVISKALEKKDVPTVNMILNAIKKDKNTNLDTETNLEFFCAFCLDEAKRFHITSLLLKSNAFNKLANL